MDAHPDTGAEMKTRQEREAEFHDKTFGEGTRQKAAKFYAVSQGGFNHYRALLRDGTAGQDVLEYGCGPGSSAFLLAREGARFHGIDISPVAIEQAKASAQQAGLEGLDLRVMDAETLDFPDGSFDLVCGLAILHHLDLARAYAEVARVLRPGGRAVFLEPLGHNPLINLYRRLTPRMRTVDEHPLRKADLNAARACFTTVEARFFTLSTLAAVPLRNLPGFRALLGALERIDQAAFRILPPARKHAWNVVLTFSGPKPTPNPGPSARPESAAGRIAGDHGP
jgi:SAM-dependent methyltransferase